jgi:NTE family protein
MQIIFSGHGCPKIVLSGTGDLYAAEIGAVACLIDEGVIKQDEVEWVGTSGGSLVAAAFANGIQPRVLLDVAKQDDMLPKNVVQLNPYFWQPSRHIGLLSLARMEKILEYRQIVPKTFVFARTKLTVVTTDVDGRKVRYFSTDSTPTVSVARAVRASASVPFLFSPVEIGGKLLVDGGVCNNFAIDYFGPEDDVLGIRVLSDSEMSPRPVDSRLDFIFAVLGSMMNALEKEHIDDALYAKVINVRVPYHPFDFGKIGSREVQEMYDIGYATVKKKLREKRGNSSPH